MMLIKAESGCLAFRTLPTVALLLALTVLLSGQPAYAHVGSTLYARTYTFQLPELTGEAGVLYKSMTLYITRGWTSATFRFEWTHEPGIDADPSHFWLIMGFDLNDNGLWQDRDNNKYTIDDAMVLSYFGWNLVTPEPCWVCPNIAQGFRVHSWESKSSSFQEIYGPGNTGPPGPLYPLTRKPVIFQFSASAPAEQDGTGIYSYSVTFKVPLGVFLGPRGREIGYSLGLINPGDVGFGFGLIQESHTTVDEGPKMLVWAWPLQAPGTDTSIIFQAQGARLLGDLNLTPRY